MENISKAQERQKKEYNARHQPLQFQEGDVVLLRNMRNEARKGGKLERAWCGPYTISAVLPKGLYRLRNDDGTELKTSYNSTRLKTYYHPTEPKLEAAKSELSNSSKATPLSKSNCYLLFLTSEDSLSVELGQYSRTVIFEPSVP